jgi:hypothetical protein
VGGLGQNQSCTPDETLARTATFVRDVNAHGAVRRQAAPTEHTIEKPEEGQGRPIGTLLLGS